ncbi:pheromone receptor transcription factor [Entomortierella parvispora]|uniref:Pheromone receptor transcription factor n=1 Tax=Entomortierella parvispora TaxID=205924 RepID=A0A9P3LYD4_9FUNG|nr:pheromone receptor transcription factor [Entomortierella parvispora]
MTTKRSIDESQTNGNLGAAPGGVKSASGNVGGGGDDDHLDKKFKQVHGDGDEDDDDDDDEDGAKGGNKRTGRRKIKIEYIEDKSRRHITFSKRKSGIMKKAYELSTLTGTQVLLLVVSETGLVYTFTTPKLQPLVTKSEGKNLIQACLHAPDKEPTPDPAADNDSRGTSPSTGHQEEASSSAPGASSAPSSSPPQHPNHSYPPQQGQQQQQQPPMRSMPGHPTGAGPGGYGSSSAVSVPAYPPPYSHIPFPPSYYPNPMAMHYQGGPPPPPPGQYGEGGYWSGSMPPQQQQQPPLQSSPVPKDGRKDK